MDQRITINVSDGITDVHRVRPDNMNAIDSAMFDALVAAGERLRREPRLGAVVLVRANMEKRAPRFEDVGK